MKAPALFSELTRKDLASLGASGGVSDRQSKKEERRKKAAAGGSKGGGGGGGGGGGSGGGGGGRGGRESKTQKVFTTDYSGGSRGGARGLTSPLFLDQTEARKVEKKFSENGLSLSQGLDDRPPPHLSEGLDPPLISLSTVTPGINKKKDVFFSLKWW